MRYLLKMRRLTARKASWTRRLVYLVYSYLSQSRWKMMYWEQRDS